MKPLEGKIFDVKPEMTLAMKLAATFAITYYGLLLLFEITTVVFKRYYFDAYYLNQEELSLSSRDFLIQIAQLALSVLLVFSLIQIFRKKVYGKAFFVSATILLIVFQLIATGPIPILKYALEILMLLIIAPIRVKKKVKVKKEQPKEEDNPDEVAPTDDAPVSESTPSETETTESAESIEDAPTEEETPVEETPSETILPEPEPTEAIEPIESNPTEEETPSEPNPTENE